MNTDTPLSQTPAALRARAARAAKKAAAEVVAIEAAWARATSASASASAAEEEFPPSSSVSAFGALTASLTREEVRAAEALTASTVEKASGKPAARKGRKAPSAAAPVAPVPGVSVRPEDNKRYRVGTYKGRAGAMYEFMKRAGELAAANPYGFTREEAITSVLTDRVHPKLATRAQVLDYVAWACRHGLIVEETKPLPVRKPTAKKGKKASPTSAGAAARKVSSLLAQE